MKRTVTRALDHHEFCREMNINDGKPDTDPIPEGFTFAPQGQEAFLIHHKRTGMGCMNVFLVVWLAFWTCGCVFLLHQFINGGTMEDGQPIPSWFVLAFWAAEVFVACLLSYLLFCKKSFRIDQSSLTMETAIFGFKRSRSIPRSAILRLVQIKDGGEGDDSFPSWGLRLEGDKKTTLIFRQPYENSQWLGQTIGQWAGVEFVESSRK